MHQCIVDHIITYLYAPLCAYFLKLFLAFGGTLLVACLSAACCCSHTRFPPSVGLLHLPLQQLCPPKDVWWGLGESSTPCPSHPFVVQWGTYSSIWPCIFPALKNAAAENACRIGQRASSVYWPWSAWHSHAPSPLLRTETGEFW